MCPSTISNASTSDLTVSSQNPIIFKPNPAADNPSHKSYHPYNEKNKQRVREDEAKAAAAELAIEQARIEAASSSRLNELRKRAGSPSFRSPSPPLDPADENLPSTSSAPDLAAASSRLVEKHRKEKARQEKREKKQKERLDFDFPSESAKRDERRRARKEGEASGSGSASVTAAVPKRTGGVDRDDMWVDDGAQGEDASGVWESAGHINLFADVEKNVSCQGLIV